MEQKKADPGALAGAYRVDVTRLDSNDDVTINTATVLDLQVRQILARSSCSRPVAAAVAEHAFSAGRAS
ncbi:hypothetical protein [Aminobacter aminovorans]|uniref:Uncharacterized protein n=1 Tax=Aminobacter aminovorans TaxID=83263 RepID=A0ABR6HB95_AMIAI|nr:hypothetical protein [Aminobacter aminovorans]MBB3707805.1 hypothetical protein [Aminobacter aminovorans]